MNSKKMPELGDLVMLNEYYTDHGRLAIVTRHLIKSWSQSSEIMITFIDTCEEKHTYVSALEYL